MKNLAILKIIGGVLSESKPKDTFEFPTRIILGCLMDCILSYLSSMAAEKDPSY